MSSSDGIVSATSIAINILMGSGFFALPLAWLDAGFWLSFFSLVVIGLIMTITCLWESDAILYTQDCLNYQKIPEVTTAISYCCGGATRIGYLGVLSASIFGSMVSYSILFSQSFSSIISLEHTPANSNMTSTQLFEFEQQHKGNLYLIMMVIFACITTPMSLFKVEEQALVQTATAIMRFVLVGLMMITTFLAVYYDEKDISFPQYKAENRRLHSISYDPNMPPTVSFSGVLSVLGVLSFALFLNSSLTAVLECLRDKSLINKVVPLAMGASSLLYLGMAVSVAGTFGTSTQSPANLHWLGFRWPSDSQECAVGAGTFCDYSAKLVEILVLLFPALDVLSVYSVNCIILTNNLLESAADMGLFKDATIHTQKEVQSSKKRGEKKPLLKKHTTDNYSESKPLASKNFERIALAVMNIAPILVAIVLPGFSSIIIYTGAISIVLCLVYPAVVALAIPDSPSRNQTLIGNRHIQWGVLVFGSVLSVVILVGTFFSI
jgi:amino acid permease